ncbi:hypothetical protein FisN_11Lh239 [Fistulifera solaris]|uniref:Protein Mpv17 n=1 Tax=Fistulifera solaris TaxID=1519565 RepID=A0A1Z5J7J3_FISSO|nr:hypothetical protein FisN_11Lh239 [Fistulifera solaris]|eukprot:GAX09788.1 hypothetical protein FisN_11Lh239 [Fistulifera solaris]
MFAVHNCRPMTIITGRVTFHKVPAGTAKIRPKFASTQSAPNNGFVAWYEGHLEARPVLTKMVTGCFLWGIGDAVGQVVPQVASENKKDISYDLPRTVRAAFFGFALHAPTSHAHFNFLEWMTQRAGITGYAIPFFKAFMEQFVYWSWISNSLYHGAMAALQGFSPAECYKRIEDNLWDTQIAQWSFWIPIQLLNFQFTPVRHQLNVVLVTSIVWTALLSMWYPPKTGGSNTSESDDKDKKSV